MLVEINMITKDALESGKYYQKLFGAKIKSSTDQKLGLNESILIMGNVEIRLLDENLEYGLIAPKEDNVSSIGLNVIVKDIKAIAKKATELGCAMLSPVTTFETQGAINCVFKDPYNHVWVINELI